MNGGVEVMFLLSRALMVRSTRPIVSRSCRMKTPSCYNVFSKNPLKNRAVEMPNAGGNQKDGAKKSDIEVRLKLIEDPLYKKTRVLESASHLT